MFGFKVLHIHRFEQGEERNDFEREVLERLNLIIKKNIKMNEQLEQQIIEAKANTAKLEEVKANVVGIAKDYASMKAKIDQLTVGATTQDQIDALKEANASQRTSLEALGLQTKELDDLEAQEAEPGTGGGTGTGEGGGEGTGEGTGSTDPVTGVDL